ncbi:hypothetical protein DACRYDRAFT_107405 [Dacryopinax primogenitus]|uniref:Uncharacterized protein n=1 Tax=Dacryopinax primogenitus (strain DJM 731) TaxID=1858805 RepID=M5GDK5_DACPD|nr:uncharacterized protein DACRYDRAFT_107405 [Dacryopinax primogenitus]EJU02488.1 hypothetical protein DACRYDRAFT_107405 [Dacryopinax primogenitus]
MDIDKDVTEQWMALHAEGRGMVEDRIITSLPVESLEKHLAIVHAPHGRLPGFYRKEYHAMRGEKFISPSTRDNYRTRHLAKCMFFELGHWTSLNKLWQVTLVVVRDSSINFDSGRLILLVTCNLHSSSHAVSFTGSVRISLQDHIMGTPTHTYIPSRQLGGTRRTFSEPLRLDEVHSSAVLEYDLGIYTTDLLNLGELPPL